MSGQGGYFLHGGEVPDADLVEGVAVGTYDFVVSLRENQVADLAARVRRVYLSQTVSVPETDRTVRSPSPRRQDVVVVRRPRQSFHLIYSFFTAAWCWLNFASSPIVFALHKNSLLSFPPEARICSSKDHFKPQISYLCPVNWDRILSGDLKSLTMIDLYKKK